MSESFFIALRESFQCSLLLALVLLYPPVREHRDYSFSVVFGVLAAFLVGFSLGNIPLITNRLIPNEIWTFWRYVFEALLFYASVVLLIRPLDVRRRTVSAGLFWLGFLLAFFEARALGFIVHDIGVVSDHVGRTLAAGLAGVALGAAPLLILRRIPGRAVFGEAFTAPSLLMVIGSLQFGFGGVRELENENILVPLQRSFQNFLGETTRSLQELLILPQHQFLKVDWTGLADFLSGDRIAISLALLFLMAPPVLIFARLIARPDPAVRHIDVSSRRRRVIASFRKELVVLAVPVLTAYAVLVVLLHAVNISLNPLYDPVPVPVREASGASVLRIPIVSKTSDLGDKKLRKYIYYYGNKEVLFIAIMKSDGSIGVALDQCEICRPADWNKDARGYAQKGENLMCKYCVTPIATNTVNTPGGCNPIPVPFSVTENALVIPREDLIRTFEQAEALERKGTHL